MSKALDLSEYPDFITVAGDAKVLALTAADITYDGSSLIGGGGGSTDSTSRRLQVDATNDAFYEEYIFRATNQYAGYTTIKTIAVAGSTASTFTSGTVSGTLTGLTNGIGVGSRSVLWHWRIEAGVFNVGSMNDNSSNASAPQFQLVVSGTNILIQVRGSGGVNTMSGSIHLGITIPLTSGGATYSIT